MRIKFTISTKNGKLLEVSGLELIEIINIDYERIYNQIFHLLPTQKKELATSRSIIIQDQQLWLALPKLLDEHTRSGINECTTIKITPSGIPIQIIKGYSRIVCFPNNKGSYEDITKTILGIQKAERLNNTEINNLLKDRIQLKPYPAQYQKYAHFFDALLVLLLIVEPSRHYPALFYTFMLFDLMDYSLKYPGWSWENAFQSIKKYRYDDLENLDIGGKYPLATHSTGSGNLRDFAALVKSRHEPEEKRMASILTQPQHHAVLTKGMTLIVHWLSLFQESDTWNFLSFAKDKNELQCKLGKLFIRYLIDSCNPASPPQNEGKVRIKPLSFDVLLKGPGGAPPKLKFINPLHKITALLSQFSGLTLSATKTDTKKINDEEKCLVYSHKRDGRSYNPKVFHRADSYCKLVPEYVLDSGFKTLKTSYGEFKVGAKKEEITVKKAKNAKLQECSYCYRSHYRPKQRPNYHSREELDSNMVPVRYEDYLLRNMKEAIIKFHLQPYEDSHYYFYCCHIYLTECKLFTPQHKAIVTKILENIEQNFYDEDCGDNEFDITSKVTRYPLIESLIRQIIPEADKFFSLQEKIYWIKRLLKASIASIGGTAVFDIQARLLGVYGVVVEIINEYAYLSEEYEAHIRQLLASYLANINFEEFWKFIKELNQDNSYPVNVFALDKKVKLSFTRRYEKRIYFLCKSLAEQSTIVPRFSNFYPIELATYLNHIYTLSFPNAIASPHSIGEKKEATNTPTYHMNIEIPSKFSMLPNTNKPSINLNPKDNLFVLKIRKEEFSMGIAMYKGTMVSFKLGLNGIIEDDKFRFAYIAKSLLVLLKDNQDRGRQYFQHDGILELCSLFLTQYLPEEITNYKNLLQIILAYFFIENMPVTSNYQLPPSSMDIDDLPSSDTTTNNETGSKHSALLASSMDIDDMHYTAEATDSKTDEKRFSSATAAMATFGSPVFSSSIAHTALIHSNIRLRVPLFKNKKHSAETLYQQTLLKTELDIGIAYDEGDCFFDSLAQTMTAIGITIPGDAKQEGYKRLRVWLSAELDELHKLQPNNWVKTEMDKDITGGQRYMECLRNIAFTHQEMKANGRIATFGRMDIEGRFICEKFGIRLHVIETLDDNGESQVVLNHYLIDSRGCQQVGTDNTIDYNAPKTIHIALHRGHFVPLLPKHVLEKDLADAVSMTAPTNAPTLK